MMDTDAIYSEVCAYGAAKCGGYTFDAHDHIEVVKRLLNEADAERKELLATNERLVDEVAELKAAYESQFKELHELKAKLTDKASLLRGCYAADHKQKQRIEELTSERDALREILEGVLKFDRGTSGRIIIEGWQEEVIRAALEKKHDTTGS